MKSTFTFSLHHVSVPSWASLTSGPLSASNMSKHEHNMADTVWSQLSVSEEELRKLREESNVELLRQELEKERSRCNELEQKMDMLRSRCLTDRSLMWWAVCSWLTLSLMKFVSVCHVTAMRTLHLWDLELRPLSYLQAALKVSCEISWRRFSALS